MALKSAITDPMARFSTMLRATDGVIAVGALLAVVEKA